ncbi:MAG: hypothetical protein EOP82_20815 [Variovorax sp.]|nr:MAG: hypothetical protein EOP82_20815 [Variovorax sp.]
MQPAVEIIRRGERNFDSSVGIVDGLQDAAAALGPEYPYALVIYDKVAIGSYPVAALQHRAGELADELLTKRSFCTAPQ